MSPVGHLYNQIFSSRNWRRYAEHSLKWRTGTKRNQRGFCREMVFSRYVNFCFVTKNFPNFCGNVGFIIVSPSTSPFLLLAQMSTVGQGRLFLKVSRSHSVTHHRRSDSSRAVIGPSLWLVPDNTQRSKRHIHTPAGSLSVLFIVSFFLSFFCYVVFIHHVSLHPLSSFHLFLYNTQHKHPCPRRNSNPQPQKASSQLLFPVSCPQLDVFNTYSRIYLIYFFKYTILFTPRSLKHSRPFPSGVLIEILYVGYRISCNCALCPTRLNCFACRMKCKPYNLWIHVLHFILNLQYYKQYSTIHIPPKV
jgi:hypothetical protein